MQTQKQTDEKAPITSPKLDKQLEAAVNVESEGAREIWKERRECRKKVAELRPTEIDPIAVRIAEIERNSFNIQTKVLSRMAGNKVMGGGGPLIFKKSVSDVYTPDHSIAHLA